jgi:hypothetical protein
MIQNGAAAGKRASNNCKSSADRLAVSLNKPRGRRVTNTVIFYEKPGCISNGKQKALLRSLGHDLSCGFTSGPLLAALGVHLQPEQDFQSCSQTGDDPKCDIPAKSDST